MPPKKKEEEPVGPDETEVRQSAVIASTFANLELQTTKKTLQQYVEFYNASREEVQRLQREVEDRDKDNIKVVRHLRDELEKKEAEKKQQIKLGEEELDKAQRRFNTERKQLLSDMGAKDDEIDSLKGQVEELQADLDALQAFKRERQEMHLEMSRFKDRQKEETARYEAEISRLRFQSLEEKVRLKAEERAMSTKFDEEVNQRAMQLLDGRTRDIHSENYMLLQDKTLLEKELESLSAEHRQMQEKLGTQRRDVELLKIGESEFAQRSVKQTRQIKDTQQKVKMLDANLRGVVEEYEIKLQQLDRSTSAQIASLTTERDRAYKNAESRHKELVKMRQLSRQLITQRSELETFFNEALEYVKGEIAKERAHFLRTKEAPLPITASRAQQQQQQQEKSATNNSRKAGSSQHPFFQQDNFEPINLGIREGTADGEGRRGESGGGIGLGGGGGSAPSSAPPRPQHSASLPPIGPPSATPSKRGGATGSSANSSRNDSRRDSASNNFNNNPAATSATLGPTGMKTDISNLTWTDKERVLRILFAKINATSTARSQQQPQQNESVIQDRQSAPPGSAPSLLADRPHQEQTFLTGQSTGQLH